MKYTSVLIAFLLFSIQGCFSGPPAPPGMPQMVPAEHVRLRGTIVEIPEDTERDSCNNCMALVRVDSIEGFGARAKVVFSNDTLPVKFMYSLNPIKISTAAEPADSLPGLNINDIFRGDIETTLYNGGLTYRIYWYVK